MRTPRPAPTASLWIAVGLLLICACGEHTATNRVLLVGIDGAALRVIEPMLEAGQLPNLASIARDGVRGEMRSYWPLESPRLWTSIASGKTPAKHRILSFTVALPAGGKRLVASHDRVGHALWNILSDRGRSVAVVNWWVTYPPETIRGVMVSDHFLPGVVAGRESYFHASSDDEKPVVYPTSWRARVSAVVAGRERANEATGPFDDVPLPPWAQRDPLSEWYLDDASVGAIALEVEGQLHPDLMMVLFKGVDAASHMLFATVELPNLRKTPMDGSEEEIAGGAAILRRFYQQADRMLGELMRHYGPEDLVLVVSDHGFETRKRYTGLTGQHKGPVAAQAIVFARGRGIAPGERAKGVDIYDVTPTILAWLGLPVAADMDGGPASFLGDAGRPAPDPPAIASYDSGPISRPGAPDAETEARIMQQLEALGYFENESDEAQRLEQTPAP